MKPRFQSLLTLLSCTLALGLAAPAAQAHRLSLLGAVNLSKPSTSAIALEPGSGAGTGFGAMFDYRLEPAAELEIGLLFVPRSFGWEGRVTTPGGYPYYSPVTHSYSESLQGTFVQVPVALRFWANPYVSLLAGAYLSSALNSLSRSYVMDNTRTLDSIDPESYGLKRLDAGFLAGLGVDIPVTTNIGIVADARYQHSLTNSANPSRLPQNESSWRYRDFQAVFGLRLGER